MTVVMFFSDRGSKLLSGPDTLLSWFSFPEDQFVKGLDYMRASLGPGPVKVLFLLVTEYFFTLPQSTLNQLSEKTAAFVYIWLIRCMK